MSLKVTGRAREAVQRFLLQEGKEEVDDDGWDAEEDAEKEKKERPGRGRLGIGAVKDVVDDDVTRRIERKLRGGRGGGREEETEAADEDARDEDSRTESLGKKGTRKVARMMEVDLVGKKRKQGGEVGRGDREDRERKEKEEEEAPGEMVFYEDRKPEAAVRVRVRNGKSLQRTKTRSRKKNLRRDTRSDEQKPEYLTRETLARGKAAERSKRDRQAVERGG